MNEVLKDVCDASNDTESLFEFESRLNRSSEKNVFVLGKAAWPSAECLGILADTLQNSDLRSKNWMTLTGDRLDRITGYSWT